MNHRLTIAAAAAVILASFSEFALIHGSGWLAIVAGAVLVVALAGTLTRAAPAVAAAGATVLGTVAVAPLLASSSPYLIAVALVVAGCCAASIWRVAVLRAFATAVTYLAALLLYLNVLLAARQSVLWLIPATTSLRHLLRLAQAGSALASSAPPVPGTPGVHLLAAAGIGVAAIAVDILAVRLRRPALAGLPLLVVYLAPVATYANLSGMASAVAFAFAAVGYMALLSADGRTRMRRWGKLVTVWHSADADGKLRGADVAALSATGRRIGLAAVCAAVIAPLLLPSLSLHHLFNGGNGTGGGGGGSAPGGVGLPDPVAQLRTLLAKTTPEPVLSYRAFGAGQGSDYLQIFALNYDPAHSKWDLVPPATSTAVSGAPLQPAPGLGVAIAASSTKSVITFSKHVHGYSSSMFFLPVPYWPQSVQVPGNGWREARGTLMIYADGLNPAGMRYTVFSGQAEPTKAQLSVPQQLPAEIRRDYLGFPSPVTDQLQTIENRITRGQHTAFLKAVALEKWFQSGQFGYTLASSLPNSPQGLLQFLTRTRHGNCQQFAFAMAVLARLAGIPSRIAIGYTPGTRQADGSWVVTTSDAHAWPELYFAGIGWLRFEPTPGGRGGQGTAVQPTYATEPNLPPPSTNPVSSSPAPGRTRGTGIKPNILRGGGGPAGRGPGATQGSTAADVGLIVLALLVAGATAPAAARIITRSRRWRTASGVAGQAEAAWLEIRADLEDFGQPPQDSDSPRALARRVRSATADDPDAAQAINQVTAVIERTRYAAVPPPAVALRGDVRVIRQALTRRSGRRARWQARLLPASTVRPVRAAFRQSFGLVAGWMPAARDELA